MWTNRTEPESVSEAQEVLLGPQEVLLSIQEVLSKLEVSYPGASLLSYTRPQTQKRILEEREGEELSGGAAFLL